MTTPTEHDRDLLLAYLYGALDEDERERIATRLAAEPALREALDAARQEQVVLGEASAVAADDVEFTPPKSRLITLRGLRFAAAFLLAAGLTFFGVRSYQYAQVAKAHPVVAVSGPGSFVPGTPVTFEVQTSDADGKPLSASIRVMLPNGENAVAPRVITDASGRRSFDVDLPGGRPGERSQLRFIADFAGVESPVVQTLSVVDSTRISTRVTTDKPLYRPGEKVRIRGVALESFRLTPSGDVPLSLRLLDPRGGVIFDEQVPVVTGVAAWEHDIPADAPGGNYKLVLAGGGDDGVVTASEHSFQVRDYRVPRLTFDVELDRASYGPGDEGRAFVSVARVEGGAPAGATVDAVLRIDGAEAWKERLTIGASGRLNVPFRLPGDIAEGRGQLTLTVDDSGTVETSAKTVPITLGRVNVELFPEGGDLVRHLENRVYVRATRPQGDAADVTFSVRDVNDTEVAVFRTDVQGMGSFSFTPTTRGAYRLVASGSPGLAVEHTFPELKEDGIALRALDDFVLAHRPIRVRIAGRMPTAVTVSAWVRGAKIASEEVSFWGQNPAVVSLEPKSGVGGVVRITVTDESGLPVAERLISREPSQQLNVAITPSKNRFAPRDEVSVALRVTDQNDDPVQAILGASVVDEGVLSLADDRDSASLPLHFLLGMEVQELEEAAIYASGPQSARAVDLLLGVQGWRRFAWQDVDSFLAAHPEDGARVAAVSRGELDQARDNRARAARHARSERKRIDSNLTGLAFAGGILILFFGGLGVGLRSLWTRDGRRAIAGFVTAGIVGCVVAGMAMWPKFASDAGMPMAAVDMVAEAGVVGAAGGVWGPPEAEAAFEAKPKGVKNEMPPEEQWHRIDELERRAQAEGKGRIAKLAAELMEFHRPAADEDGDVAFEVDDARMKDKKMSRRLVLTREFAHRPGKFEGVREDFSEVLYWHPLLISDENGLATLSFQTSDSVTSFRIALDAHDGRGALAASHSLIENRIPFYVEPKIPVELSAGDRVWLPVSVVNDADAATRADVTIALNGGFVTAAGGDRESIDLPAASRDRVLLPIVAGHGSGVTELRIVGRTQSGHEDTNVRPLRVVPRGYPITIAKSGLLEKQDSTVFALPADLDRGTLRGSLRLYPSTLATLVDGLDELLRQPGGCFEQASSTNYPNVLVLRYLQRQDAAEPEVARRANDFLASGYQLLTGYECKERGYEWFGGDPGHEALSAYGLMEFVDMKDVFDVDDEMIDRTRDWLLARRDGDGGYQRNDRALDSFGSAPQEVTNAYVTYALSEAEVVTEIPEEIAAARKQGLESDDPYIVALAANTLANVGDDAAGRVLDRLAAMQQEDGKLVGKSTSITSSSGPNLEVETTALAALAFSRSPDKRANTESAIRFILSMRQGGRFGTTQATILALRALIAHAESSSTTETDHDIQIVVNGAVVAERHVPAGAQGVIAFDADFLPTLENGANRLELRTTGGEPLPWALSLAYHAAVPASSPDCRVDVTTELAVATAIEGETVGLGITLRNLSDEGVPMTIARVGLPAGLEPRADQLEELKEAGTIDFYELRPREITVYFRSLPPSAEKRIDVDLVAAIPGQFEGPASSVYLYYGDDLKHWTEPLTISISPR